MVAYIAVGPHPQDLFADFITELGTAKRDYKDLAQLEKLTTGGIGAGISSAETLDGVGAPQVRRFQFEPRSTPLA